MARFRKKPIVIEAYQLTDDLLQAVLAGEQELQFPVDVHSMVNADGSMGAPWVTVSTLEGVMTPSIGDWIITGVNGEKYPCKPDIFEKTYEAVDGDVPQGQQGQ